MQNKVLQHATVMILFTIRGENHDHDMWAMLHAIKLIQSRGLKKSNIKSNFIITFEIR